MLCCTFWGHRDAPSKIKNEIRDKICFLIENFGVSVFMVGGQGNFDRMVLSVLRELKKEKDDRFRYYLVLAQYPQKEEALYYQEENIKVTLPFDFENYPKKYAVDRCNHYMLGNADFVISYVNHSFGGAYKFVDQAIKQHKCVYNLGNYSWSLSEQ